MDTLLQDLRYATRTLLKSPGFALVAVLTLGLGIGANTAIFSVVDGVLLRQLPYPEPERILVLWQANRASGEERQDVSPANFLDWRDRSRSFTELAAIEPYGLDYLGSGEPVSLQTWRVTEEFFRIMGVRALHGRTFLPEDYATGRTVILDHRSWQQRFGADPALVGRTLVLDGEPFTVVGIMPPEFRFPEEARELWAPLLLGESDRQRRSAEYLKVVGRLRPGVTPEQAQAEMSSIAAQLAEQYPRTNAETGATVVPLPEQLVGRVRPALLVLLGAVGFVLLIACANVANLLLARAAGRRREFAIRAAIGAGRSRLVRQIITESVILALLGGTLGVLLAYWGVDLIVGLSPAELPRLDEVGLDGRVLGFALAASLLTALLFGLVPALHFSRPDLQRFLNEGGRAGTPGSARRRLRSALVIGEIALALVLLIGAGLLLRSFAALLRVDPGFGTENRLAMQLFVFDRPPAQRAAFFEELLERVRALPGVREAGAASAFPLAEADIAIDVSFTIADQPDPVPGQEPSSYVSIATPGYFRAMEIPLRHGRLLSEHDGPQAPPVALVNEAMARRYWPDEDPVGKRIALRFGSPVTREIVGVVGDVRHTGLATDPRPQVYLPLAQYPFGSMTLVVRTESDPLALLPAVKREVWELSPTLAISSTATLEQLLARSVSRDRFHLVLLGCFAAIALLLATIGIYGLISYTTRERTHEIGIRMALGAGRGHILRLMLGQGMLLALGGVVLGIAGALLLTRFLQGLLFGIEPTDPLTFAALATLVLAVAAAATYLPARRAARVDPMIALHAE